jgi:hypothetical protein
VPRNVRLYQFGCGCADRRAPCWASLFGNELPPASESPPRRSLGTLLRILPGRAARSQSNSSRLGKDDRLIMRQALAAMLRQHRRVVGAIFPPFARPTRSRTHPRVHCPPVQPGRRCACPDRCWMTRQPEVGQSRQVDGKRPTMRSGLSTMPIAVASTGESKLVPKPTGYEHKSRRPAIGRPPGCASRTSRRHSNASVNDKFSGRASP